MQPMRSELNRKLSPEAKRFLMTRTSEEDEILRAFLRLEGGLSAERCAELQKLGVEIQTVAGDVITTLVPVSALARLVELPFVEYFEFSRSLYPEDRE